MVGKSSESAITSVDIITLYYSKKISVRNCKFLRKGYVSYSLLKKSGTVFG